MYTLVFSDRDGTINLDKNFYLGSSSNWREQVSFLDGVVDGIKLINQIPNSRFFILTNQSGVALEGGNFDSQRCHFLIVWTRILYLLLLKQLLNH